MKTNPIKIAARIALFAVALALTACATHQPPPLIKGPDVAKLGHKPSLYIVIQRDRRLPAAFTSSFKQITQQTLPEFSIAMDEGLVRDAEVARADWVMTVRTTRVIPHYTFQPSSSNALNGVNDCVLGSVLVGLLFAPCVLYGDEDFLEASIRDAQGKTLQTYQVEAEEAGFIWLLPPSAYIGNLDEKGRWERQIISLYEKVANDKVFEIPNK